MHMRVNDTGIKRSDECSSSTPPAKAIKRGNDETKDYKLSIGELAEDKFPDYNKCTHSDEVEDITKGMFISPKDTVVIFGFKIIEEYYSDYIKYLDFDTETEDPRWNIELSYSSIYEEMDWDLE